MLYISLWHFLSCLCLSHTDPKPVAATVTQVQVFIAETREAG